jgi:hypothetical protein
MRQVALPQLLHIDMIVDIDGLVPDIAPRAPGKCNTDFHATMIFFWARFQHCMKLVSAGVPSIL